MNKTQATKLATNQLRSGYFQTSGTTVEQTCPKCRTKISAEHFAWYTPRQRVANLRDALVSHLLDEHQPPEGARS